MANRKLVRELGITEEQADEKVTDILGTHSPEEIQRIYAESMRDFQVDTIIKGRIVGVVGDDVLVDIGYKSEGIVPKGDFGLSDEIKIGEELELLLESVEGDSGMVTLSKQKADKIRGWERIIQHNREGDVLKGKVIRKIKGGLLVDVGVPVFLPASQADIRKMDDIGELLGLEIECKILKIDEKRMNVIVSRRKLMEEERQKAKEKIFNTYAEGDVVEGVVKNLAEFGAFVDLGGVDGLLHITDLSWGRVGHPSEVVKVDEKIKVKILRIDRDAEKIALGFKQLARNPWETAVERYSPGTRVTGRVVNLQPYGAFVELEPGIEGLVHVSEMSWTKQVGNPSEVVSLSDTIEIVVKSIDPVKEEISLSLREAQVNPWQRISEKYPVNEKIKGKVRSLAPYGVFVEIEEGIEGLLHINDVSWTKRIAHPSEMFKKGDRVDAVILSVDIEKKRIALGRKQLFPNPWDTTIPERYREGSVHRGRVNKIVSFGAFVELERDLEGLLHTSRMGGEAAAPSALKPGDVVDVKVVRLDPREQKIALALVSRAEGGEAAAVDSLPKAPAVGPDAAVPQPPEPSKETGGSEVPETGPPPPAPPA